ncbi:hypothetical protein ACFXG4_04910 [Nocardia sp. NPDC059246]|uniref:hypothetical protein n=1 Tax=unclassified Nocardia TaxID=2637762 RepID=UPI0036A470D5
MAYGVLIILVPTEQDRESLPTAPAWAPPPTGPDYTAAEKAVSELLAGLARRADPIVEPHGGRTLVAHTPRHEPPIEHVNVWIDEAGDTLLAAMHRAGECAGALEQAGLAISSVEQINWEHAVLLA